MMIFMCVRYVQKLQKRGSLYLSPRSSSPGVSHCPCSMNGPTQKPTRDILSVCHRYAAIHPLSYRMGTVRRGHDVDDVYIQRWTSTVALSFDYSSFCFQSLRDLELA